MLRGLTALVLTLLGMSAAWAQASVQAWPSKQPIRVVVPIAAGSGTDLTARLVFEQVSNQIGQAIVVENRVGAGGILGTDFVAKSAADGYTLLLIGMSSYTITAALYAKLPYDTYRDLVPVTVLAEVANVLVIKKGLAPDLKTLIANAKKNPGKLSFTTYSAGTSAHFLGVQFNERFGVDLTHAPYRGSAPQVQDLIAGHAQIGFVQMPGVMAQIEAGTLRPIVTTGAKRFGPLPDTPTLVELGYPDFLATVWYGLMVRSSEPQIARCTMTGSFFSPSAPI